MAGSRRRMTRKGRGLKMLPAALMGAGARSAGPLARMAAYAAGRAARKYGTRAAAGATAAVAGATLAREFAETQRRATDRAGVTRALRNMNLGGTARRLPFTKSRTVRGRNPEIVRPIKVSYGRKRPMNVKTLSKVSTQRRIYRFQNVAQVDRMTGAGDRGAYFINTVAVKGDITGALPPTNPTVVNAGQYVDHPLLAGTNPGSLGALNGADSEYTWLACPVHMYLLNSVSRGAPDAENPDCAYRLMIRNNDIGQVGWWPLSGSRPNPAGGVNDTTKWTSEYESVDVASTAVLEHPRYVQKNWYDIKLYVRNAFQQQTKFRISVVSFADDHFDPLHSPATSEEASERHAFWYGIARRNTNHPLQTDKNFARVKNKLVVHKSVQVIMEKNQTTDTDASPYGRVVKVFYRDGSVYDYMTTTNADPVGTKHADAILNPNLWEGVGKTPGEYSNIPKPKARKWLMVTAFDPTVNAASSAFNTVDSGTPNFVQNSNPSYDIILRAKETRFPDFTT